jgi:UPF0755 protein
VRSFLALIALTVLAVAGWLAWGLLLPIQPHGQKFVLLRPGYTSRHIADELQSAGAIRSARAFLLWHYLARPRSLKAGEYLFDQPADALRVHRRLVRGDIFFHTVVIPEGYNLFDVARAVDESGLAPAQEFLLAVRSDIALISDLDPQARSLEGYLFPDTYQFTRTQSLQDIIAVMVHRFRRQAEVLGLKNNVHQIVTMASIVEKETGAPVERAEVASVYYNRLNRRIALAADPSVIYGLLLQNRYQGALHHEDMQFDSPYNTYRYPGLPPGPIANPGVASLQAALHPASTSFLYFVSDGNGHHRFATTLDEHNRNVAMYRRAVTAANR